MGNRGWPWDPAGFVSQTVVQGCGDFGIELSPALWGRGYATEAGSAMLDFAFRSLGLELVRSETVSPNARVAALLTRLGFRRAGSEPGSEWMAMQGWTRIIWELRRDERAQPLG